MGTLLISLNSGTTLRRETLNGRKYLVARSTLIVPGVLPGSQGALYYPPNEVAKPSHVDSWNGMPLMLGHPTDANGEAISARSPGAFQRYGLGHVYNARLSKRGRLTGEAWFDVEQCRANAPEVLDRLRRGKPFELSTGLYTSNVPARNGATANGRGYTHVARNYRPDHLAILLDQPGACSLRDGCGVMVDNAKSRGDGRWVTTDDGNRLFLKDGRLSTSPGGKTVSTKSKGDDSPESVKSQWEGMAKQAEKDTTDTREMYLDDAKRGLRGARRAGDRKGAAHHLEQAKKWKNKLAGADGEGQPIQKTISDEDWDKNVAGLEKSRAAYRAARKAGKKGEAKSRLNDARRFRRTLLGNADTPSRQADLLLHNCGGPGSGKPGPCPTGGADGPSKPGISVGKSYQLKDSNGVRPVTVTKYEKNRLGIRGNDVVHYRGHDGKNRSLPIKAFKSRITNNSTVQEPQDDDDMRCVLNSAGVCVNCGGPGSGKPGPCPSNNPSRGFQETQGGEVPAAAKRFQQASEFIQDRYGLSPEESRNYLDSTFGRHVGERLSRGNTSDALHKAMVAHHGSEKRLVRALTEIKRQTAGGVFNSKTHESQGDDDMATKKHRMVEFLTRNCDCWNGEGDAATLAKMDEAKLRRLVDATKQRGEATAALNALREEFGEEAQELTFNSMPAFVKGKMAKSGPIGDEEGEAEMRGQSGEEATEVITPPAPPAKKGRKPVGNSATNAETPAPAKPVTVNEWLASAPAEVAAVVSASMRVHDATKADLVNRLVRNSSARTKEARESLRKVLGAKSLDELNTLAALSVNRSTEEEPIRQVASRVLPLIEDRAPNYGGLGEDYGDRIDDADSRVGADEEEPLGIPTVNWADEAKAIPTGGRHERRR